MQPETLPDKRDSFSLYEQNKIILTYRNAFSLTKTIFPHLKQALNAGQVQILRCTAVKPNGIQNSTWKYLKYNCLVILLKIKREHVGIF